MKKSVLLVLVAASRAMAGSVEVAALPEWSFADTEVSTNCPLRIACADMLRFSFSMALAATPSNNVQVAFGRDANTNGVLEAEEQGLVLGWDCGAWAMRKGLGAADGREAWGGDRRIEPTTGAAVKDFEGEVWIRRRGVGKAAFSENGQPLDFGLGDEPPNWLFDRDWDMLRATVRGVDTFDGRLRARIGAVGTVVIIR